MGYLYHRVPTRMEGETLYPLNELRGRHPETYFAAARKYEGREQLMEREVPYLDCLWNDALHLSPVHPDAVRQTYERFGQEFPGSRYFRVPAESLPPEDCAVYLYLPAFDGDRMNPRNWERFDPRKLDRYDAFLPETVEYYRERFAADKRPLLWVNVPHILYRGTLETRDLEIIDV